MNLATLSAFLGRADVKMAALFPASIVISGVTYPAIAVGGAATRDYLSDGGGNAPGGARHFRVSKSDLSTRPESGTLLIWAAAPSGVVNYTITEVPDRPHETSWSLTCVPRSR